MILPWMKVAQGDLGLVEIKGPLHEKRILRMFADVGHGWVKDDETAWCGAGVGSWMKRAGYALDAVPLAQRLSARGWLAFGEPLPGPRYGCIGVKKRVGGTAWQGHVGLVVAADETHVWMLGGNQSDSVKVSRFPRKEFLGWRWPDPNIAAALPPKSPTVTAVSVDRED